MSNKSITLDIDPSILERNMKIIQDNPMEEELKTMFSSPTTIPSKLVKPMPGFCVKTFMKPDSKKVFVNICITDAIPCPRDISTDELMLILNSEDPSSYRVPMSIGEGRLDIDKSGAAVTVYDVAINPNFYAKVEKDELFQTFFLTVVFEGLQDKYQFELDMQKYVILKNRKSIGTLQTHRIQIRDIQSVVPNEQTPLIQEINATRDKMTNSTKKVEVIAAKNSVNDKFLYRLRREPPTGEIDHLLAEFKVPHNVGLRDLCLEVGEDRLVLESKGCRDVIDFFLPCNIDQQTIVATLNRNNEILSVKMPALQ